jgi:hypothetical protein
MQFRLQTLFLLFVVLWSSLAVFGGGGGIVAFILTIAAALILNSRTRLFFELLVLLLFVLLLLGLLLPAVQTARESAGRGACHYNLRQITLAILNYEAQHHRYPPAYVSDKNGRPMHSWRVLILPYLGRGDLYKQYNFDEPWDGPNNRKLLAQRPGVFACPNDEIACQNGTATSYVAVTGRRALWRPGKPRNLDEISGDGGTTNTVMLVEVGGSAGINWIEPRDFCLDEAKTNRASSFATSAFSGHWCTNGFFLHNTPSGFTMVSFADGHLQVIPADVLACEKLQESFSVGAYKDEEAYDFPAFPLKDGPSINWPNCCALVVWIASVGLLLYRSWRSRTATRKHEESEIKATE